MRQRVLDSINGSTQFETPWRHWTSRNVFSDSVITSLHDICTVRNWPERQGPVAEHEVEDDSTPVRDTQVYLIGDRSSDRFNGARVHFTHANCKKEPLLRELVETYRSKEVIDTFNKLCGIDLYGQYLKMQYFTDREGWSLGPHHDHANTCNITYLVYIPKDGRIGSECGTEIYDLNHNTVKKVKYGYNKNVFFVPCDKRFKQTWHGFNKDGDVHISTERNLIMVQYIRSLPDTENDEGIRHHSYGSDPAYRVWKVKR